MKRAPWPIGRPFPVAMTDSDFMSVLQLGHARFYALKKAGKLDHFKLTDPIGRAMWSGKKIRAYVEDLPAEHEFRTKAFAAGRRMAAAS